MAVSSVVFASKRIFGSEAASRRDNLVTDSLLMRFAKLFRYSRRHAHCSNSSGLCDSNHTRMAGRSVPCFEKKLWYLCCFPRARLSANDNAIMTTQSLHYMLFFCDDRQMHPGFLYGLSSLHSNKAGLLSRDDYKRVYWLRFCTVVGRIRVLFLEFGDGAGGLGWSRRDCWKRGYI